MPPNEVPILIAIVIILASTFAGLYVASLCRRGLIEGAILSILCGPVGPLLMVLLAIHQQREAVKQESRSEH